MAITLGKDASGEPFGGGIISASYTEEREVIDISNRDNIGGSAGGSGYKAVAAGFTTKTWDIECHDATGLVAALSAAGTPGGFTVMSLTENIAVDGAITFSITAKQA